MWVVLVGRSGCAPDVAFRRMPMQCSEPAEGCGPVGVRSNAALSMCRLRPIVAFLEGGGGSRLSSCCILWDRTRPMIFWATDEPSSSCAFCAGRLLCARAIAQASSGGAGGGGSQPQHVFSVWKVKTAHSEL